MQSMETANVTNPPNATEGVLGLNLKFASLSCKDYTVCRVNELHIPAKYYKQLSPGKKKQEFLVKYIDLINSAASVSVTAQLKQHWT